MIARQHGTLSGVTTASTIWVTAALGMGIGLGLFVQTAMVTAAVLLVLWFFPDVLRRASANLTYEVVAPYDETRYEELQRRFEEGNVKVLRHSLSRNNDQMTCIWFTSGRPANHQQLSHSFVSDLEINRFNTSLS